jgi:hypothetical protein
VCLAALPTAISLQASDYRGFWLVLAWVVSGVSLLLLVVGPPLVDRYVPRIHFQPGRRGHGTLSYSPPPLRTTRRLKKDALALAQEMHAAHRPGSWFESAARIDKTRKDMDAAESEEEKHEIWSARGYEEGQRFFTEQAELQKRFGGELAALLADFKRRGLVDEGQESLMLSGATNYGGLARVAAELEALARQL